MSTQEILAELPLLSLGERAMIAKALQELEAGGKSDAPHLHKQPRRPDLHPGAWEVAEDFDEPLPDSFWLGEET